ncbi:MAG: Hpt domain-containing protein, partial [Acidiferrobacteraceae bacterium]
MAATGSIDPSTLSWVKAEIDETLKRARGALESFIENPADDTRLRFCITYLHQVVGTLQMVELDAPALLAREIELLAEAVFGKKVPTDRDTFDLLTRSILSLPDYLARLQFGQSDVPLRLAPLINDLRKAQGSDRLSEMELFAPDLDVVPPDTGEGLPAPEFQKLLQAQRAAFQSALVPWLRDPAPDRGGRLAAIVGALRDAAPRGFVRQFFWVAAGFMDALCGEIDPVTERKRLAGKIEQQVKKFIESPGSSAESAGTPLVKAMLFELGAAGDSQARVREVRDAFHLASIFGAAANDDSPIEKLPPPDIIQSLSVALTKELETAEDLFSTYLDPEHKDAKSLRPLHDLVAKTARTLDMLGLVPLRALAEEIALTLAAVEEQRLVLSDALSMRIAASLLQLENSARDLQSGGVGRQLLEEHINSLRSMRGETEMPGIEGFEVSDGELSEGEFHQLLGAVGNEIRSNLAKIEESFETFAAKPDDRVLLQPIPGHLVQIQGALQILGQDRAAELVAVINQYIQDLSEESVPTGPRVFEALAVGIGTIGAYLDGLGRGSSSIGALVDRALGDLDAALGASAGAAEVPPLTQLRRYLARVPLGQAEATEMRRQLQVLLKQTGDTEDPKASDLADEVDQLLAFVEADVHPVSADVRRTLTQSIEALARLLRHPDARAVSDPVAPPPPEMSASAISADAAQTPEAVDDHPIEVFVESDEETETVESVSPPVGDWEIDQEIIGIFVEDARDISRTLEHSLDAWEQNLEDHEALVNLRRAFHTLKGSGRMVGAADIAELSWDMESHLNHVREGRLAPSPELFALLREVRDALPRLIDALESGGEHPVNVDYLRSRVQGLTTGATRTTLPEKPPVSAASPPLRPEINLEDVPSPAAHRDETQVMQPVPQRLPGMDPTLLQIFSSETGSHINVLHEVADQAGDYVSASLLRAVHTLQGSARAVGLIPMADACFELERLLLAMDSEQRPLSTEDTAHLKNLASAITATVEGLRDEATAAPAEYGRFPLLARVFRELVARIVPSTPEGSQQPGMAGTPPADELPVEATLDARSSVGEKSPEVVPSISPQTAHEEGVPADADVVASAPGSHVLPGDIDVELVEIFREEASDILETLEQGLVEWRSDRNAPGVLRTLKRALHTLKGGARMIGAKGMGDLSHVTETILKQIEDGVADLTDVLLDQLDEVHDLLRTGVGALLTDAMPEHEMASLASRLGGGAAPVLAPDAAATARVTAPAPAPVPSPANVPAPVPPAPARVMPGKEQEKPEVQEVQEEQEEAEGELLVPAERREYIKVRAQLLNELVNYAGEVSISRARMEQQIFGLREHLVDLQGNVARFKDQLRDLEMQAESQILFRTEQKDGSTG